MNVQRLLRCGAITTPAGAPLPARLRQISEDMHQLLAAFRPDAMAVEELFFNQNVTTGIGVAQARGVILLSAEQAGVPIFEYTPSQVKQAVAGYGKAEKRQVMEMTRRSCTSRAVPGRTTPPTRRPSPCATPGPLPRGLSLLDSARPGSGRYAARTRS